MEAESVTYWATLAQVMPIVALGIVVEARGLSANWNLQTPTVLKAFQSLIWAVMLSVLAFGESKAISALRGVEPADYWSSLCESSISSGLGVLVLAPALEMLVKAYALQLAGLFSAHPIWRARMWRLDRVHRRLERKWEAQHESFRAVLASLESTIARAQALLREAQQELEELDTEGGERSLSDDELARRQRLTDVTKRLRGFIEENQNLLAEARAKKDEEVRSMEATRADYLAKAAKQSAEIEEARRQQRLELAEFLAKHPSAPVEQSTEKSDANDGGARK